MGINDPYQDSSGSVIGDPVISSVPTLPPLFLTDLLCSVGEERYEFSPRNKSPEGST